MTWRLHRYHQTGDLHLITISCYQRRPYLDTERARDCFEQALEAARLKHDFRIYAYVVMPEHVHLLLSEGANLSKAIHALKPSVAKQQPQSPFWTPRFHDFNVFSEKKFNQKVGYIHDNPVARGLVPLAEMWRWSSLQQYVGKIRIVSIQTGATVSGAPGSRS